MRQQGRRESRSPQPLISERGSPTSLLATSSVCNASSSTTLDETLYGRSQLPSPENAPRDATPYSPPEYKRGMTFDLKTYRSFSSFSSFSEKSIVPLVTGGPCAMWWAEIAWLFLSIILVIVIAVVLNYFDGQSLPEWPEGVSVNTLLALLVGICRASFAWPVAEGISQLKWNWFAIKERRLADFEAFDEASRGPYGSLKLLQITKGRYVLLQCIKIRCVYKLTSGQTAGSDCRNYHGDWTHYRTFDSSIHHLSYSVHREQQWHSNRYEY
jgi:hypothetical protein